MFRSGLIFLLLSLAAPAMTASCKLPALQGGALPGNSNLDVSRINAEFIALINYHRCKNGRKSVKSHAGLIKESRNHSNWMAKTGNFTHKGGTAGRKSVGARIKKAGFKRKSGAENVGFRRNPCSYGGIVKAFVGAWMASSAHRDNILRAKSKYGGASIAISGSGTCGNKILATLIVAN